MSRLVLISAPAGFGKTTAQLHGLLARLRDLGATLLSLRALEATVIREDAQQ